MGNASGLPAFVSTRHALGRQTSELQGIDDVFVELTEEFGDILENSVRELLLPWLAPGMHMPGVAAARGKAGAQAIAAMTGNQHTKYV
jgi:hypothetical protein